MLYSTAEGSRFWCYVERSTKGTWIRLARRNHEYNIKQRSLPPELWIMILDYVWSWSLPKMRWAWVSSVCKRWNLLGAKWKAAHKYPGLIGCSWRAYYIPEEQLLSKVRGFPILYDDEFRQTWEYLYQVLLTYRPKVLRDGAPFPCEYPFPLSPCSSYDAWWKEWGIGKQLDREFVWRIWSKLRNPKFDMSQSVYSISKDMNPPRHVFQTNQE